jgi:hypothetical protein
MGNTSTPRCPMIRFTCPHCQSTREISASFAGIELRCVFCKELVSIPHQNEQPDGSPSEKRRKPKKSLALEILKVYGLILAWPLGLVAGLLFWIGVHSLLDGIGATRPHLNAGHTEPGVSILLGLLSCFGAFVLGVVALLLYRFKWGKQAVPSRNWG